MICVGIGAECLNARADCLNVLLHLLHLLEKSCSFSKRRKIGKISQLGGNLLECLCKEQVEED